jgi:hypothetical protein
MINDLRKSIHGDFDASHLLRHLETVQKPFSADHWRFTSPAVMLGTAIILAVVDFSSGRNFGLGLKNQKHNNSPLHSNKMMSKLLLNQLKCHPFRNKISQPRLPTRNKLKIFQNPQSLYSFTLKRREGIMSISSQFFSELMIYIYISIFTFSFTIFILCLT